MCELLVEVTRGPLVENVHYGSIAVVDTSGKVIAYAGDPHFVSYMRSSAKPLQASAALEAGTIDRYGISERELAVMCASHIGDTYHVEAVSAILEKIGLTEDAFTLGPVLSMSGKLRDERLAAGVAPRRIYNNCSGKHSCMLALCQDKGWDIRDYQRLDHPVQQLIRATVAAYCEMQPDEIIVGVDGCGVPVFAMPLDHMALSYCNLTNPEQKLPPQRAAAARRITRAMGANPEMIAGFGMFCTSLISATHGRIIGKLGADAVYCCAPVDGGLGIALKITSGNAAMLAPVMVRALKQLDLLSRAEQDELAHFAAFDNYNCQKDKVGETRAVFDLHSC